MEDLEKFILGMLKDSGELLVKMQQDAISQNKSERDLVTSADLASEKLIIERIREKFPSHKIYSEESERKKEDLFSENCWVVDPLDGTNNYAYGFPIWGVSIAYAKKGELVAGGIAFPTQGIILIAQKGKGAYCYEEGKRDELGKGRKIHVSARAEMKKYMVLICADLSMDREDEHLKMLGKISKHVFHVREFGAAVFNLGYCSMGLTDACILFKTQPYDSASGALLVREAGGKATDLKGNEWKLDMPNIVCSNGKNHEELIKSIGWRK